MKTGRFETALIAIAAVLGLSTSSQATVIGITNGDFEAQSLAEGTTAFGITNWFESNTTNNNFADYVYNGNAGDGFSAGTNNVLGFSATSGFAYQQIGTYTPGENVRISGTAIRRNGSSFNGFTIDLFAGNFAAGESVYINSPAVTSVGSQAFAAGAGLTFSPDNDSTGAFSTSAFSVTFSPTNPTPAGTPLWLRITRFPTGGEIFLDNLVAVPEPSSLAMLLFGSAGLWLMQRKREV